MDDPVDAGVSEQVCDRLGRFFRGRALGELEADHLQRRFAQGAQSVN